MFISKFHSIMKNNIGEMITAVELFYLLIIKVILILERHR